MIMCFDANVNVQNPYNNSNCQSMFNKIES
jgi:hypothetical protein